MKSSFLLQLLDHSVTIESLISFGSKVSFAKFFLLFVEEVFVSFVLDRLTVQPRSSTSNYIQQNGDQFQAQH